MKHPNRVRELRVRSRLSQTELAKLIDRDETSISRYESGEYKLTPELSDRLARVFKCDKIELFFDPANVYAAETTEQS